MPSNYSGIERACESLYARLAARGHQITLYCRSDSQATRVEYYRGIRLLHHYVPKCRSLETLVASFSGLLHAVMVERYDIIHLHALAPGLFTRVPRLWRVPTVVTIHGLDWQRAKWKGLGSRVLRRAEVSIARHATEIIAISRDLQNHFLRQYALDIPYIPNGIERSAAADLDEGVLRTFDLTPQSFISYVGRLVPEKRIEDVIVAFRRVNTAYKLAIVGESGSKPGYMERLSRVAEGDSRIVFTGHQRGLALNTLYQRASAFVLASELEGLPMSLLEAMERGIPAVVSDIPPHRELLGSIKGYDLFFPCKDIDTLASRFVRVVEHREHYTEVASLAQAFVRESYSWDVTADATERLFYRVIRNWERPPASPRRGWTRTGVGIDADEHVPSSESVEAPAAGFGVG